MSPQADAKLSLGLVRVAEVIEERVEDVVQVLERRKVEPYVPLSRRIGQSQDDGCDMDPVVRYEAGVFTHGGEPIGPTRGRIDVPGSEWPVWRHDSQFGKPRSFRVLCVTELVKWPEGRLVRRRSALR